MNTKARNVIRISLSTMVLSFSFAAVSSAHECYVANKPDGAGAVTEADLKVAGNSGQLVAPGAFFELSSVEPGLHDLFIRGGSKDEDPSFVGAGSMHESPATEKGSDTNGVQKYHLE